MQYKGIAIASIPSSRTGKDTVAKLIIEEDNRFGKLSLAEPLKDWATMIFHKNFHDDAVKVELRQVLQILGTDHVRNEYDKTAWIQTAVARTELFNRHGTWPVVTDLRAENEVFALKDAGYFIVLLTITQEEAMKRGWSPDNHSIENELMNVPREVFDLVLENSRASAENNAQDILTEIGL